jgi:hypothetical protein
MLVPLVPACAAETQAKSAGEIVMNFDRLEYQVGELAVAPQLLTIDRDGHARYESHTNWGALDRPEIGTYEMTVPNAELQNLGSALGSRPFNSLPDHWGKVKPGDRYRRVRVTTGGATAEKLVGTKEGIDAALAAVLDRLDAIVALISSHPRQVLRVELRQPSLGGGATLTFVMVLSATGTEQVSCRNPIDLVAGENGSVSISLWPDTPASELRPADTRDPRVKTIRQLRPPATTAVGPILELRPGESAEFQVDAVLPVIQPGNVVVRVAYANFIPLRNNRNVMVGELMSRTTSMAVTATPAAVSPR